MQRMPAGEPCSSSGFLMPIFPWRKSARISCVVSGYTGQSDPVWMPVFVFVAGLAGNGVVEAPLRALQKIHTGYNN